MELDGLRTAGCKGMVGCVLRCACCGTGSERARSSVCCLSKGLVDALGLMAPFEHRSLLTN